MNNTIAILDTGVHKSLHKECNIINEFIIHQDINDTDGRLISHGYYCCKIINMYCKQAAITSIVILDHNDEGLISNLDRSLMLCLKQKIFIVNMSLGSINFKDISKIRQIINKYSSKGIIIISALSNSSCASYPAVLSNVIGVRALLDTGIEGLIAKSDIDGIDFFAQAPYKINDTPLPPANSFACPVITAKVTTLYEENINVFNIKKNFLKHIGYDIENEYYRADWVYKGYFACEIDNNLPIYFCKVDSIIEADTIITSNIQDIQKYSCNKNIIYLGNDIIDNTNITNFVWSKHKLIKYILQERINIGVYMQNSNSEYNNINDIPVIAYTFQNIENIYILDKVRQLFMQHSYNALVVSSNIYSILCDIEYIPNNFFIDTEYIDKILQYLDYQVVYRMIDIVFLPKTHLLENKFDFYIEFGDVDKCILYDINNNIYKDINLSDIVYELELFYKG